ncbi:MAG: 50S ribosomal protein L18 [Desulfobacteraceae bacterium]|jgi:large subunit ribosomal protein L18
MAALDKKRKARLKRKARIRKSISGTPEHPRLSVFRSAKHIYAQVIDDVHGRTLVSASSLEKEIGENTELKGKTARAVLVGKLVARRALDQNIKSVVFDRNGFLYHGRVKAVSDGAREGGLDF